jgi:hypothetical protein
MMIEEYGGRCEPARCPATTEVTATEWEALAALPDPVDPALLDLTCELAAGHEDRHVAFAVAASGGNQVWWLRWAGRLRDVVRIELCDGRDADEQDDCLLPYRHSGPHSFEIRPVHGPRNDVAPQSGPYRASPRWPAAAQRHQQAARQQ